MSYPFSLFSRLSLFPPFLSFFYFIPFLLFSFSFPFLSPLSFVHSLHTRPLAILLFLILTLPIYFSRYNFSFLPVTPPSPCTHTPTVLLLPPFSLSVTFIHFPFYSLPFLVIIFLLPFLHLHFSSLPVTFSFSFHSQPVHSFPSSFSFCQSPVLLSRPGSLASSFSPARKTPRR